MNFQEARKKLPQFNNLPDDSFVDVVHRVYYPNMDKADLASRLGYKAPEAPAHDRTWGGLAKDVGITALRGAIGVPEAVVGMADLVSGGQAGKALESVGFRPKEAKEILSEYYSDKQKKAFEEVQKAEGFMGTMEAALRNPSVIAHSIGESVPSMLGGAVIGRGIVKGASMLGAGGAVGGIGAGAVGEGLVAAGSAGEQIRQQTPDGLLTGEQAGAGAATGVATAVLGAIGGKIAQKLGIADVDTMLVGASKSPAAQKGIVRSVLEGAAAEGILEELPQSISEQVLQNHALGKPLDEGIDQAAVLGLLSGAAMGGGANILNSIGQKPADAPRLSDPGKDAAHSIMDTKLVPETGPMTRAANVATAIEADQVRNEVNKSMVDMLQGQKVPLQSAVEIQADPVVNTSLADQPAADQFVDVNNMVPNQSEQPLDMVPPGVDPATGEMLPPAAAPEPLDFTGKTDEELQQARKNAQDPTIRKALATELQARKASKLADDNLAPVADKPVTLPKELAGAKEKYNYGSKAFTPQFESDVDRAAFIVSQKTPSKRDADYLKFAMDATGMTEAEVRAHGQKVRDSIKGMANGAEPGKLTVPKVYAPKAAPKSVAELDAEFEQSMAAITPETGKDAQPAPAQAPDVTAESAAPVTQPATSVVPEEGAGGSQPPQLAPIANDRYGIDHTPFSAGGKPFKTKVAAGLAKKLQPAMRVVKVDGGFALTEKTAKQLAAEAQAVKRIRNATSGNAGMPMSAHEFIAAEGGMSRDTQSDLGIQGNPKIGNRWLFAGKGKGLSIEQAAMKLRESGYTDSEGESAALDIIRRSITQPQYTPDGWERIGQTEQEARFEDYLSAQADEHVEDDQFLLSDAELQEVGYSQHNEDTQAEIRALIAQAEALGIDAESIIDDAVRKSQNATQQDYENAAKTDLTEAIAHSAAGASNQADSRNGQERSGQEAIPSSNGSGRQDSGKASAEEAGSEGLTSYSPGEIRQRQEAQEKADKKRKQQEQNADRKAQADAQVGEFTLTGSDRVADVAAAQGQNGLFDAPALQAKDTPASRWTRATTNERIGIARAGGISLRAAENVAKKGWDKHDPVVQEKLARGIQKRESAPAIDTGPVTTTVETSNGEVTVETSFAVKPEMFKQTYDEDGAILNFKMSGDGVTEGMRKLITGVTVKGAMDPASLRTLAIELADAEATKNPPATDAKGGDNQARVQGGLQKTMAEAGWVAEVDGKDNTIWTKSVEGERYTASFTPATSNMEVTVLVNAVDTQIDSWKVTSPAMAAITANDAVTADVAQQLSEDNTSGKRVDETAKSEQVAKDEAPAAKPADTVGEAENSETSSFEAVIANRLRKIADDVEKLATGDGKRPLDVRWAEGAIKRLMDSTGLNAMLGGKQFGPTASAKIALGKDRVSIEGLRKIADKLDGQSSKTDEANQAAESPKLTQAEAADLMAWESLGTKGGVTKHILTFFESKADKDANRGRMTVATVTKGDRSASAWIVDGDDQTFGPLSLAKKRGMEVGMAKAVADGFVEGGEAKQSTQDQAPAKAKKKPLDAKNKREELETHFRPGNVIQSDYWKEFDRVVDFAWNDGNWKVTVEKVVKDGEVWKATEGKRTHMTTPDARDKVVFEAPVPEAAPEARAEPAPAKEAEQAKPAKIEDSGEVLEGARKLYAKSYAAKLDEGTGMETASVPLSKSWPEPDYQRLIDEGADPWAVALARAVRDEIPTKPMKGWKLKGWVAKVEGLREMAQEAMNGSLTKERFTQEAGKFRLDDWLNKVDLYEAVGHAESLKGMKFAENTYSFFGGQKFDQPKKLWTVNAPSTSASATWSNGNWGNDLVVADTKAEAIEKFKAWVTEQASKAEDGEGKPAGKRTSFDVYSYRNNPKVFIVGKRISATKSIDLMKFESSKEAQAFIVANQDKLETMLAEAKAEQSERREENAPRVGDDHRSGGDVTTEQFRETFGFRGEQFGVSMPQAERQDNLNRAYDALMDLAGVIGVPPKALSLNGELGLAFGARGHGGKYPALAHYEADTTGAVTPNRVVINLTRKNGAGSLAHEWFHAVDNYFARMRGEKGGMLTESYPAKREGVRPEMVDAFKRVMSSIQASGLRERSKNLDKKRTKDYWSTGLEMAARSFESYVIAKLQDKSGANDYLANILPESAWLREDSYPYPTMGELPLIRAAFDNFFAAVQTKETDKGVAMFSRSPDTQQAYEARIDALFAGEKANLSGVHLLDKSDVMDLLGMGNMPVRLDEAKVVLNQTNHPEMTAEVWKKIPEWLDNPALVAKSSTVDGRYVITPSETVLGAPVRIIVQPKGGNVMVHALVNAYAKNTDPKGEIQAISGRIQRGHVVYVDTKKAGELLGRSGLQLPRVPSLNTDRTKILTEKNLSGYRKAQDPAMSRGFGAGMTKADAQDVVTSITDLWGNAPKVVVVQDMQDADVPDAVRKVDAKQKSQGAGGEPEGFFYDGKAYIVAGALKSPGNVMRVLFHETLGHYGLRGTFGDGLTPILKQLSALRKTEVAAKAKQYGLDMSIEADRLTAAEEVLAEMAQSQPNIGFVKRVIALIRGFLRKNVPGFSKMQMTDEDIIANYILPARKFVERGPGGTPKGGVSFSRGTKESMLDTLRKVSPGDLVDGRVVRKEVPNMGSIGSSLDEYSILDGVREVPMSAFDPEYIGGISAERLDRRTKDLAEKIKDSGELNPLIVAFDSKGAYVIEGGHRFDALIASGAKSIPAVVVIDENDPPNNGAMFSRTMGATELAGQVRDKLFDVKGVTGNTLAHYRGMALQALGRRQLVDLYGDLLPQLKQYDELVQRMDAEKNDSAAEADAIADEWSKLDEKPIFGPAKNPGMERKLAELMHDATLAQMDPDKPLQDGDNPGQHAALKAKFEVLSPQAQSVYRRARDMYEGHYAKVREAIQERIMRSELGASEKKAMIAKMDADFFQKTKGVYFPLARFGKYVMVVKDAEGKTVNVSRAETLNEAETTRKMLLREFDKAKGFAVTKVMKEAEFNRNQDMVGKGFVSDLFAVLDKQGVDDALRDSVSQLYLSSLPDLSWAKHGIHRKGTPGFSQDARRAFAQNVFHGARYLAKLRYSDQMQNEITAMGDHIKVYEGVDEYDGVKAQQVLDEMAKRHDNLMSPETNSLSTALTSVGYMWFMGLSPAAAMVNLTQTALVAYPVMGAKWGYDKAASALLLASKQTVQAKNDISKILKGDELDAYNRAVADGTIDVTMAHDLAGISQGEDAKVTWALRPVMKVASFMFHHAERFNRQATFIASYRLAKESGVGLEAAFEQAKKATYDGHFDYSSSNRPRIMQGNVARVVFLFKQYGQNMIYTMSRQAYLATQSLNPKERAEARKQLGGMLALHAAAAGGLGLPLVGALLSAASFLGGDDDEPWDAEVALKNAMADAMGPKAAEVMAHGLSRLTPWDLSGRVALNKLILPDVQEGLEGQRWAESMSSAMLGPVWGIVSGMAKGVQEMGEGRYQRGLENMLPVALRNPVKALRYQDEGAIDKTGVAIKDEVSMAGVLGQASGFAPSEVRAATEVKSAIFQHDKARMDRRKSLMSQFAQAQMAGDSEGMQEMRQSIAKFNAKNPERKITPRQLIMSVRNRERRIEDAEKGVYLPKNRRDAIEAVRFSTAD